MLDFSGLVKRDALRSLTRPELSNMSFEDIMKLQSQVGTKAYNKLAYGGGKSGGKSRGATKKKRLNKNR